MIRVEQPKYNNNKHLKNNSLHWCTNLAKIFLSLFNCYSWHLAVPHQIHSFITQSPLPTRFQCQVWTYCTEKIISKINFFLRCENVKKSNFQMQQRKTDLQISNATMKKKTIYNQACRD